jgi:hypothetical protein
MLYLFNLGLVEGFEYLNDLGVGLHKEIHSCPVLFVYICAGLANMNIAVYTIIDKGYLVQIVFPLVVNAVVVDR